jgi:hypothetical protein
VRGQRRRQLAFDDVRRILDSILTDDLVARRDHQAGSQQCKTRLARGHRDEPGFRVPRDHDGLAGEPRPRFRRERHGLLRGLTSMAWQSQQSVSASSFYSP